MKITKQARGTAKGLLQACRRDGLLDEALVRQTVDELVTQKPRGYAAVLQHFQRLVKLDLQRRAAQIESAAVLPADTQNQIRQQLTARYGPGLSFAFSNNPALLGGIRVRVGSDVYDGTVRGRLAELEQSFEAA